LQDKPIKACFSDGIYRMDRIVVSYIHPVDLVYPVKKKEDETKELFPRSWDPREEETRGKEEGGGLPLISRNAQPETRN
jgi:hypothetical protein